MILHVHKAGDPARHQGHCHDASFEAGPSAAAINDLANRVGAPPPGLLVRGV